jgi:MarR family transcriptional regulator for hemolysin
MRTAFDHDGAVADRLQVAPSLSIVSEPSISVDEMFDLLRMLEDITRVIRKRWDQELQKDVSGMSTTRASIITHLARRSDTAQVQLARIVGVSQMNLTRLLDDLEEKGWVERRASATDRRVHGVRLTAEGQGVLDALDIGNRDFLRRGLGGLDETRLRALIVALAALKTATRTVR